MSKNLKWSYLLCFILSVVVIAWRTLSNFFGGVGINYITLLVIVAMLVSIVVFDKETFNRTKDLFIAACVFTGLETIIYFPFEFGGCVNYDVAKVFFIFQNVYACLGLLFLGWLAFRFITEVKNVKVGFVEAMLGNSNQAKGKKVKKAKELSNGSLEEKPNARETEEVVIDEFDEIEEQVAPQDDNLDNSQTDDEI